MTRPLRISYAGAWYHVMNRGADKQKIFHSNKQREIFLNLLHEIHNRYQIEIHAYCLMNNHYHLLIRTPLPNISRAMRHLNGVYTQRYNASQKRDGPLLRGRFKAILVDAEDYLLRLSRYIHLNPVAAELVAKPEDYHWSSYKAYLNPNLKPIWLLTNNTLKRFGDKLQKQKYKLFVNENIEGETGTIFETIKKIPILGCDAFVKTISDKYLSGKNRLNSEISKQAQLSAINSPSYDQIVTEIARYYQVNNDDVVRARRGHRNQARDILIYLAYTKTDTTMQDIANIIGGIGYSAVSKICQRCQKDIATNQQLANDITVICQQLTVDNSQLQT